MRDDEILELYRLRDERAIEESQKKSKKVLKLILHSNIKTRRSYNIVWPPKNLGFSSEIFCLRDLMNGVTP